MISPYAHKTYLYFRVINEKLYEIFKPANGQVTDFRAKLIASGFFSNVSVEEQSPTPDRQRVNLRMIAQWKPAAARNSLAFGPTASEIEQAKTNRDATGGGGFPPGMMP